MPQAENVTGKRIVAALIDIVILGIVFGAFAVLFGDTDSSTRTPSGTTTSHGFQFNLTGWPFAIYLVVVMAYYTAAEAALSATPGKLALGLRVASVDGSPMSVGKVVVRNLLRIADGFPFLYLVGIITIAASKRDQRVGDMAAGTIVIRAQSSEALSETAPLMPVDTPDNSSSTPDS